MYYNIIDTILWYISCRYKFKGYQRYIPNIPIRLAVSPHLMTCSISRNIGALSVMGKIQKGKKNLQLYKKSSR